MYKTFVKLETGFQDESCIIYLIRLDGSIIDFVDLLSQVTENTELVLQEMEPDLVTDEHDVHEKRGFEKEESLWPQKEITTLVS